MTNCRRIRGAAATCHSCTSCSDKRTAQLLPCRRDLPADKMLLTFFQVNNKNISYSLTLLRWHFMANYVRLYFPFCSQFQFRFQFSQPGSVTYFLPISRAAADELEECPSLFIAFNIFVWPQGNPSLCVYVAKGKCKFQSQIFRLCLSFGAPAKFSTKTKDP